MEKRRYITPHIEEIHLDVSRHLLSGSDGGHHGGNPRGIDDDDDESSDVRFNRVGYSYDIWSSGKDNKNSSKKGLWD